MVDDERGSRGATNHDFEERSATSGPTKKIDGAMTLDRGLRVLSILARSGGPISAGDIADEVGISRQGAYRILATLCDHHLAVKVGRGGYRYGAGILTLARGAFTELEAHVRPRLIELAERVGAAAHCAVADGADAVTLTVAEPSNAMFRFAYERGSRHPLSQGASGIAILSSRPPESDEAEQVSQARSLGYAVTMGTLTPGAIGIAVPLRDSDGQGIETSIGIVTIRAIDVEEIARDLVQVADSISQLL